MDDHQKEGLAQQPVNRKFIQMIAQSSNWMSASIKQTLFDLGFYPSQATWYQWSYLFFIGIGVLFTLSGVVFFFAYNWDDLPKFVKMGLVLAGILVVGLVLLVRKKDDLINKSGLIILTILTGVLFAVYGQIYQTGANAYDFFLSWTIIVIPWVIISRHSTHWFLWLILLNVTTILFFGQVLRLWNTLGVQLVLFWLNAIPVAVMELLDKSNKFGEVPRWLIRLVGLAAVTYLSIFLINLIESKYSGAAWLFGCVSAVLVYGGAAYYYSQKLKDIYFIGVIPFSLMIVSSWWLAEWFRGDETAQFFLISFYIMGYTTALVLGLIRLNRKWAQS